MKRDLAGVGGDGECERKIGGWGWRWLLGKAVKRDQ